MTAPERDARQTPVTRRAYLTALGASTAVPLGATQLARAEGHGYGMAGYGADGYGGSTEGTETGDRALEAKTRTVTDIGTSSATFTGELTELDGYDSATVLFEWGESNNGLPNETAGGTLDSEGEFEVDVSDLKGGTDYSVRAVAEVEDTVDTGETLSFTTEGTDEPTAEPLITELTAEDVSNPRNPHVDAAIDWRTTIDEGELAAAELILSGSSGVITVCEHDLDGASAEGSLEHRISHGAGDGVTYTVELTVESGHDTQSYDRTTFESQ